MLGTATKLKHARNINLLGAVSGSGSFNGSGDLNINTTQTNISVLTGSLIATKSSDPGNSFTQSQKTINYPSGFTKDNSVVIAVGTTRDTETKGYSYEGSENAAMLSPGLQTGNIPKSVQLNSTNIRLAVYNWGSSDLTIYYKIVLMKIS